MTVLEGARLFHVNVNCSDLERSRPFYEALGLTAAVRTAPDAPQPGAAFGLDRAWWDAWIMLGARGFEGAAIDLLEWRDPPPVAQPPASLVECGFQRIGCSVTDLDAAGARVADLGGAVWSAPATHTLASGGTVRLMMTSDPDGTAVELIEGKDPRVSFVAVSCADLERSARFYADLGCREVARFPSSGDDGAHLRIDGPFAMDEIMLAAPGGGDAHLLLVGFRTPPAAPAPAPVRPANTRGIWRSAFLVPDLDAAWTALDSVAGAAPLSAPVAMAMGGGLPQLRFVCFRGPDGEVLELIEQPDELLP